MRGESASQLITFGKTCIGARGVNSAGACFYVSAFLGEKSIYSARLSRFYVSPAKICLFSPSLHPNYGGSAAEGKSCWGIYCLNGRWFARS
jgi:hypothetical protein